MIIAVYAEIVDSYSFSSIMISDRSLLRSRVFFTLDRMPLKKSFGFGGGDSSFSSFSCSSWLILSFSSFTKEVTSFDSLSFSDR